ncbi:MAG: WD40 repeat domain-containing protein [Aquificaceae bacterium]|nr:WD40 repeat domain-containing protein [Aquificaceae bacterium]
MLFLICVFELAYTQVASGLETLRGILVSREEASLIASFEGHQRVVYALAFSPDGKTLASVDVEGSVKLWDVQNMRLVKTIPIRAEFITSVVFTPNGRFLAIAVDGKAIRFFDVKSEKFIRTIKTDVYSLSFDRTGKTLASGGYSSVKLWDVQSGRLVRTIKGHNGIVLSVHFSPDGKTVASGGEDGKIKLWEASTSKLLRTLEGHEGSVFSLSFSPTGKLLASGGLDGVLNIWDVRSGKVVHSFTAYEEDGEGGENGEALEEELEEERMSESEEEGDVDYGFLGVAFSPDGKILASGNNDGFLRIWDVQSGELIMATQAHEGEAISVAFSPDGKLLLSGGADGVINFWNVEILTFTWLPPQWNPPQKDPFETRAEHKKRVQEYRSRYESEVKAYVEKLVNTTLPYSRKLKVYAEQYDADNGGFTIILNEEYQIFIPIDRLKAKEMVQNGESFILSGKLKYYDEDYLYLTDVYLHREKTKERFNAYLVSGKNVEYEINIPEIYLPEVE